MLEKKRQEKQKGQNIVQKAPGILIPRFRIIFLSCVLIVILGIGSFGYVKFKMLRDSRKQADYHPLFPEGITT